ncbi:MAG: TIGR00341 family protein [Pseudomonadota bacterium]
MRQLSIHVRAGDPFELTLRVVRAADPIDYHVTQLEQRDRKLITVFLRDGTGQMLMDSIQDCLKDEKAWRITLQAIEATSPRVEEPTDEKAARNDRATREEIFEDIASGARLDRDFLVLVILSTVVAAIGLNANGVAAVIGAMVIAPLLGPILAFSLGVALGDDALLKASGKTLAAGVLLALLCSVALSFMLEVNLNSRELISRAEVRLDGLALAMAAGGAAALSITRGQGAVLVGVMVAAALLPPGAAIGLFAGAGEWIYAGRAALLLTLNVASLVLSALIVFWLQGVRARGWIERENARRAVIVNAAISVMLLLIAAVLIIYLDLGSEIVIG